MTKSTEPSPAENGHKPVAGVASGESVNQLLADYYRLQPDTLEFDVSKNLSEEAGFFKFGEDVVCFGRCAEGSRSTLTEGHLYDTFTDVRESGSIVTLPFDPTEIVQNLRYERYLNHRDQWSQSALHQLVTNAYYLVRPALHVSLRKWLQKVRLNGWQKLAFPHWPVDRTVERLMRRLLALGLRGKGLEKIPFIWFWPDGMSACAMMTHDLETKSGQSFCPQLMDIDEEYGIPASFQIVPENRYPVTANFLDSLRDRGFEVNVQDLNHDGRLFSEQKRFQERAVKINGYAKEYQARGFRSAVLYRNQDWYSALDFEYDMSVPNVAHLDPQRGGCCTVMPYFVGKTLELPVTTTQDYSLFHILNDYSLTLWERQIGLILEEHGLISFIAHPDYLITKRARDTYRRLLGLLKELRAWRRVWVARPQEVNDWWRTRSRLRLRQDRGVWRIEGPGSEQARVAFATLREGQLVYSVI